MKSCIALSLLVLFTGCSKPVDLTDLTGFWNVGDTEFLASIKLDSNIDIQTVSVRYARHFWPGYEAANQAEATLLTTGPNAGKWRAIAQDGSVFWEADSLFYEWVVTYQKNSNSELLVGRFGADGTSPYRTVVGCSEGSVQATLNQLHQVLKTWRTNSIPGIHPDYKTSPAHLGPVSLEGQGVPYSHTATVLATATGAAGNPMDIEINTPALLLYKSINNEGADLTDGEPENSYVAIGAAYGSIHKDAKRRPRLGCLPSEHWFVHEAGYHLQDGGFEKTAPNEAFPGEVAVGLPGGLFPPAMIPGNPEYDPGPPEPVDNPITLQPPVWHPRLWDVHVWLAPDGQGDPPLLVQILHPDDQNGNPFPPGLAVPDGTFFFSETFQ